MRLGDSPLKKKNVGFFEKVGNFFIFTLISFILIFVDLLGALNPIYNGVSYVTVPVQYYVSEMRDTADGYIYIFMNLGKLADKIVDLRRENAKLKAKVAKLIKYKRDAEVLRDQLGVKQLESLELEEADIIGGDITGSVNKFRVNKGKKDGVKYGMAVVYQEILIGRVEKVYDTVSVISFLTNPDTNVVAINERSRHRGIVHGSLAGLEMDDILQKEDIVEGDKILTLGDRYPAGLLIGTVQKVQSTDTSSKKIAILVPAIDYNKIEKVFIVTNFEPEDISNL